MIYLVTGPPAGRAVLLPTWSEVRNQDGTAPDLPPNKVLIEVRDEDVPPPIRAALVGAGGEVDQLTPALVRSWQAYLDGRYQEHAGEYLA